ncbi:recombinase family protein [Clostridium botulinum]|nr:recombinase family protein [Clostridium botulinum]
MKIAIYSRKSIFTGKGDSIENQIELCKEYINRNFEKQVNEFIIYEDEGFSGGNTNRPQFQQLLKDAKAKKFDALICYRLDRISRNVADFSTTLEILQSNSIDFISLKEQFDTSTPMGRAMVYISSVFAQLERETIAERVRDNMLQLAKTGRWLGGQAPLGFEPEKLTYLDEEFKERTLMKLTPNEKELEIVRFIYKTYLEEQSINKVVKKLNLSRIKGKNNGTFSSSQVGRILKSAIYVKSDDNTHEYMKAMGINVFGTANGNGYLTYNKTKKSISDRDITEWISAISKHKGIIESSDWLNVQDLLEKNKSKKIIRLGTGESNNSILSGVLKCSLCGANMLVREGHRTKNSKSGKFYYYICSNKLNRHIDKCKSKNIRVDRLDNIIIAKIKTYNKDALIHCLNETINIDDEIISKKEQKKNLIQELSDKKLLAKNLVKKIALLENDEISEMFIAELTSLNNEIKQSQLTLDSFEKQDNKFNSEIKNIQLVINSLKKFNENIELTDDVSQKRFLIQSIIDKIIWDGDKYEAKVLLLQLGSLDEGLKKK